MTSPPDEMTCKEVVELVTEYFENALAADDRARFEAHLAECPYCRTYLEHMRATLQSLRALSEDALSPDVRDELVAAFRGWKSGR